MRGITAIAPALARSGLRAMQRMVRPAHGHVRVLCYHLVGADTGCAVDVSIGRFTADLASLRDAIISLEDALRGSSGVVLTFDDAYANFYSTVFPLLEKYQSPATLYVPTGFIDGITGGPIRSACRQGPCTWWQLREMSASGLVTIGAHTVNHPNLTHISLAKAKDEIIDAQVRLEDEMAMPIRHFCYPRGLWNRHLEQLVQQRYSTAMVGGGRAYKAGRSSPTRIERVPVRYDSPPAADLVAYEVWLEERAADIVRRLLR